MQFDLQNLHLPRTTLFLYVRLYHFLTVWLWADYFSFSVPQFPWLQMVILVGFISKDRRWFNEWIHVKYLTRYLLHHKLYVYKHKMYACLLLLWLLRMTTRSWQPLTITRLKQQEYLSAFMAEGKNLKFNFCWSE